MNKKIYTNWSKENLILEIEKLRKRKQYGLVWEDKEEDIVEKCKINLPILEEIKSKELNTDSKENFNIIIEGDNYHSLSILNYTHQGTVDLIYIDPPYNRPGSKFKYNNNFIDAEDPWLHSTWLSFMYHRLSITKGLLKPDGVFICAIDEKEQEALGLLIQKIFPNYEIEIVVDQHNKRGKQGKNLSFCHEYHYFVFPKDGKRYVFPHDLKIEDQEPGHARQWGRESDRDDPNVPGWSMFYPIYVKNNKIIKAGEPLQKGSREPRANEPTENGMTKIWPIDRNSVPKKWAFGRKSVDERIQKGLLIVEQNKKNKLLEIKAYKETSRVKTLWVDKKFDANVFGTKLLSQILGKNIENMYPKSIYTIEECLKITLKNKKKAIVLDYFAGSGTTGHAVLNLNAQDNGKRTFILCTNNENGENIADEVCYPRIKNVITGYKFKGKQEKILFNKELKFEDIEANKDIIDEINNVIESNETKFQRIIKTVEGGNLKIIGQINIDKKTKPVKANLKYFKTAFVPAELNDKNKILLAKKATEMICIKENTFKNVINNKNYKIFKNNQDFTFIIYDQLILDKIKMIIPKYKGNIKLYIFSFASDLFEEEFDKFDNVNVESIPEPILSIYKRLFT